LIESKIGGSYGTKKGMSLLADMSCCAEKKVGNVFAVHS